MTVIPAQGREERKRGPGAVGRLDGARGGSSLAGVPKPARGRRARGRPAGGARTGLRDLEELANLAQGAGDLGVQVRRIGPLRASKAYICPGCQQEIPVRTGHLVVVPVGQPDLRRHWHTPCWASRDRRRPGR
ncbi:MAG: hypothetical protein ACRDZX_01640 [Acidimicrobiales bacterium]